MKRLANYIEEGHAALLIVDEVEGLAAMHHAQVATILGMLNAIAVRTGAAVVALAHNPALNYPRAVTAMQRRLAQASVVFTTAVVEPGGRRFLVPLRPAMSGRRPRHPLRPSPFNRHSRESGNPGQPCGQFHRRLAETRGSLSFNRQKRVRFSWAVDLEAAGAKYVQQATDSPLGEGRGARPVCA